MKSYTYECRTFWNQLCILSFFVSMADKAFKKLATQYEWEGGPSKSTKNVYSHQQQTNEKKNP